MRSALLSVLLLLEVGSHQSMERSVPSKSSAYRSLVGTLPLLSTLAPALRHRRESACWRPALYCSVCGPRTAASAHGRAAQHQLRGGAGSLEDALEDMGMDDGEASGGRGMAAEEEIDDMGEEDSEFDSGDDAEGPRAKKGSARKKREQQVLDKIARTAQINSTYLSELEKEAAALRKTREEEEEMLAKEERAMRESEDTDELVKEAELIHRDLTGNPNLEGLGDPADDEEPWDELERDEEALRLLSSWAKYKNETDISANISRELKALRQELSEGENGLEYHGKGVGLGARAKELAADDDIGSDEYKLGYTEMLERIFGPGVKAQGWLAPSRFGMQGLEYAVDKEFKAIANDRNLTANVLLRAAAAVGNATAIRRLCQQGGASPGAKDSWLGNVTALHRAASNGHTRAVRELIRLGADVDEVDSTWGRNALHMAARCGHVSTVKALVEAGADVNLTCRRGMTVLEHTVAVLLRRQLQPSSAANAGTEFEPNDAGSTDAVSSSESEMESLENFLTEFGKGTREDHAGRGFREEGAEVDGMREFADVAEMNVVRTRRGGATREEEGQEGVSKKVVSVDSRRARREEDRDLERAEENLLEVLEGLDFMASEEVVHDENLTSPATPATRVPRDLLSVETVRLRRQMLLAEKRRREAGRAAADPNIADLEEIVRFLQVEMNAKGSTLASDYEVLDVGMEEGGDGRDVSESDKGMPIQSNEFGKRGRRGVGDGGGANVRAQVGKDGLDAMLQQVLDVAGVGRKELGKGGAAASYEHRGEDEYEEMQRLHDRAEAALKTIFKEEFEQFS